VDKTTVVYVTFLRDVACQKLLKSANVSRSYSKNNTGTVFLRHGVHFKMRHFCKLSGKDVQKAGINVINSQLLAKQIPLDDLEQLLLIAAVLFLYDSRASCSGTLCQMTFNLHHQFLPFVDF